MSDISLDSVRIGTVLVDRITPYTGTDRYASKVVAINWLTLEGGTEKRYYVVRHGKVSSEAFTPNEVVDLSVVSESTLPNAYDSVWEAPRFKAGDFLTNEDHTVVFFYESVAKVWRLNDGKDGWRDGATYGRLSTRELTYGKLRVLTTALGTNFRDVVSGDH